MLNKVSESERWLLSFYRSSEIGGALFFGRLAKSLPSGQIQVDMSKHFSDEAQHAWLWTKCMDELGVTPLRLSESYQDQYASTVGIPANLMEVLAITQVFERRVVNQYAKHASLVGLNPIIKETLRVIMKDEKWHLEWIQKALKRMEPDYGREAIEKALKRFTEADEEVYQSTVKEHETHIKALMQGRE